MKIKGLKILALIVFGAFLATATAAAVVPIVNDQVSTDASGVNANATTINPLADHKNYNSPATSGDGRYVAFGSLASNFVSGDTNNTGDVYVKDRQTGAVVRASLTSTGTQVSQSSTDASMTYDGRYVAFTSKGILAPNANNSTSVDKVYIRDMQAGTISTLTNASGGVINGSTSQASMSADGRFVVFASNGGNLISPTTGTLSTPYIFIKDQITGAVKVVSKNSSGPSGDNLSPVISCDGGTIIFVSSTNFAGGGTYYDAYVVTLGIDGDDIVHASRPGNYEARFTDVSCNGVYTSVGTMSMPLNDPNRSGGAWIYNKSLQSGSLFSTGGTFSFMSLSNDGRYGSYLISPNIRVVDFKTNTNEIVSRNATNNHGGCSSASISDDATNVAYTCSQNSNSAFKLVPNEGNDSNIIDVFNSLTGY